MSLVNPHDIAWWYELTNRVKPEATAPQMVKALPPNFETPEQLTARDKPLLQQSLQLTSAESFGPVPFTGSSVSRDWLPLVDLYMKLQLEVDTHIGTVLHVLASRPKIAANTVIVFTSDHGEYGASHGMRGKGAAVYDEGIHVPLIVKDLRGTLTRVPAHSTSAADLECRCRASVADDRDRVRRLAARELLLAYRRPRRACPDAH